MNKRNKILVGCLALLLVLSVGYALFSETVTINGTATAKGNFELTTSCVKGISTTISNILGMEDTSNGYENDYCDIEGSNVNFGARLLYPTASRFFVVEIKNTGTIDAVINSETGITMTEGDLYYDSNGDDVADTLGDDSLPTFVYLAEGGIVITDQAGNDIREESSDEEGNAVLKVGNTMHILVYVKWPDLVSDDSVNGTFMEFKGNSIKFDFVQRTL